MLYQLRPASVEDKYFMMDLERRVLTKYFINIHDWSPEYQKEYYEHYFRPEHVFIIQYSNEAIGAISVLYQKKYITIFYIYLLPQFQGKGIGKAIMSEIMERARKDGKSVIMSTYKKSIVGKKLCDRFGFKVIDGNAIRLYVRWDPPLN